MNINIIHFLYNQHFVSQNVIQFSIKQYYLDIIRNKRTLFKLCTQFVLTFFQVHPDEQLYDFYKTILIPDIPMD